MTSTIKCKILSVEGNIGSGKSTLVQKMKNHFENNTDILFLQEPVDEWQQITDTFGKTVLEKYYGDQEKYAFSFQMMAYITRLSQLRKAMNKGYKIIITERCVFTDKFVFAKMLYDEGKIEDVNYQIYNKWFDEFIDEFPEFKYIYLKTSPQIACKRVKQRQRPGEETIPIEYLKRCHDYHENWLLNISSVDCELLILDGDTDTHELPLQIDNWIDQVNSFMEYNDETLYTIKFDGGSRGNPGPSGCGFVIYKNDIIITKGSHYLGENTNNYAEYKGVILALKEAHKRKYKNIIVKGDSLLVINQLKGIYKCNSENLIPIYKEAKNIMKCFKNVELEHVKRNLNKEADTLANKAMDDFLIFD